MNTRIQYLAIASIGLLLRCGERATVSAETPVVLTPYTYYKNNNSSDTTMTVEIKIIPKGITILSVEPVEISDEASPEPEGAFLFPLDYEFTDDSGNPVARGTVDDPRYIFVESFYESGEIRGGPKKREVGWIMLDLPVMAGELALFEVTSTSRTLLGRAHICPSYGSQQSGGCGRNSEH